MLSPFKGKASQPGLTAVALYDDGVSLVRVVRDHAALGLPRVTVCEFRPWDSDTDQVKALTRLAADYQLKKCRCTTSLNMGEYSLLLTEAPDVAREELRSAIRWRIKDLVDFPIQDATIDVFDLPADNMPGRQNSVYAVAARNNAIRRRVELMDESGINLDIIDIPELAQRNLAALLPQDEQGTVMLSLAPTRGLITITRKGEIYLSRTLDVGYEQLRQGGDLSAQFDRIVLEVQRSLDYYDSYFRMAPMSNMVIAPIPEQVPGLLEHLDANLSVTPSYMDLSQLLEFEVSVAPQQLYDCLWSLGTALRFDEAVQ